MMQCGLFVAAESFHASVCRRLFTHYKREEDPTMQHGRLDEELSRMARLAEALTPDSLLLLNESFSATNEREGSEIARQVIQALVEAGVRVFFVTHLGEFARGLWEEGGPRALFLRAERQADGRRTFRVLPGEPLETSFGADLYGEVFGGVVEAR
jgi:DNA mismatch repair ATPase MutS